MIRLRTAEPQARASAVPIELRDHRRLCFYAATFNTPTTITENGKRFREVIRPGAFTVTLAAGTRDVYACLDHKQETTFSTRSTGLLIQEDARGLFCSCWMPSTPAGDQILAEVRSGKLKGCSFKFYTVRDQWTPGDPLPLCEVLEVDLVDVCLTATPAYPATDVAVRSTQDQARDRRLRLLKLQGG